MKKIITAFLFVLLLVGNAHSAQVPSNITPQQLEQFKRLPPAQQKALAQSMGIDFNTLRAQLSGKKNQQGSEQQETLTQLFPRGTQFDEFGNPQVQIKEEVDDDKLKPFGYDVFANEPLTFAPSMDIAIPEKYIVGPGDTLSIKMFGKENNEYALEVSREGDLVVPNLGAFNLTGMTFVEAKAYLANEIKNKVLGVDVIVTLVDLRSIRVFVLGDAYKPGQYVLNSLSSATHAIIAAGGISDIGSLRNIEIKRGGKVVARLDLYDLLIKGDSSDDIILRSGDVVFIAPVGKRVTVDGEVKRPAIYELVDNESYAQVIKMAGGLLPSAYPSATVVEGFNHNNLRTVQTVDFSESTALNKIAQDGDVIKVMKTSEQYEDSVTLIGAVTRPGKYQWFEGQKVTDLIESIHSDLLEDADLAYSIIIREQDVSRNIDIEQFSLFKAVSEPNGDNNLVLQPRDKLLVFSNTEALNSEVETLDSLAKTKEQLVDLEKEAAEKAYQDSLFWQYYSQDINSEDDSKQKAKNKEKQNITTVGAEEIDLRNIGYFSRQRLLAPVIDKLKRQAASGDSLKLVEIDGAVKYPGLYPLVKNARITQLITAAGGLNESAFLSYAELTRNEIVEGIAEKESVKVDLFNALKGDNAKNRLLKSKDRLNIHQIPSWQENHIVELKGEFVFPGKYTIRRGETIKDLIERAGGFTEFAYTEASLFTRESLKELEIKNLVKVSEQLRMEIASKNLVDRNGAGSFDYNETKQLLTDLTNVKPIGRLVVDIPKIVSGASNDVTLEDGDMLYIPSKQNFVNVVGQVQVASSHIFQPELDTQDYLTLSGGVKEQADQDRIYIIKANGRVEFPRGNNWFSMSKDELKPGDTVVVPMDSYYMEDITLWQTATQIIYQTAVAIAAISSL